MSLSRIWVLAFAAAAAAMAAYVLRAMPLACAPLALLCIAMLVSIWRTVARSSEDTLHDPAISTLVFPPESRFRQ